MRIHRPRRKAAWSLTLALMLVGIFALQASGVTGSGPDLVTWSDKPLPTSVPQTEAQKEYAKEHGRALPAPELLQPSLDPALPTSHPAYRRNKLRGDLKRASSDVLPGLARAWVAKLQQYYPKVRISVDPPYAGSLGAIELIKGNLDCVFVSRELKPTDISQFRDAFGYDPFSADLGRQLSPLRVPGRRRVRRQQGQPARAPVVRPARPDPVDHPRPRRHADPHGGFVALTDEASVTGLLDTRACATGSARPPTSSAARVAAPKRRELPASGPAAFVA